MAFDLFDPLGLIRNLGPHIRLQLCGTGVWKNECLWLCGLWVFLFFEGTQSFGVGI